VVSESPGNQTASVLYDIGPNTGVVNILPLLTCDSKQSLPKFMQSRI